MHLSIHNRRLLRGIVAGTVALAGASACSHSDRANAGRDTTQAGMAVPADTTSATSDAPVTDTASNTAATATQAPTSRIHADSSMQKSDKGVSGYRAMERDTTGAADSAGHIRPSADSSVSAASNSDSAGRASSVNVTMGTAAAVAGETATPAIPSDTSLTEVSTSADSSAQGHGHPGAVVAGAAVVGGVAAAGNDREQANRGEVSRDANTDRESPIARDSSTVLAQGDTVAQTQVDTSSQALADTATIGDTAVILTDADSTQRTGVGAGAAAGVAVGAAAAGQRDERVHPDTVSKKSDELAKHEPARVRQPEDSTELHGNVTTDRAGANADAAPVGAAGVASTGNIATGAEAVAQMSRQGQACRVADRDENRDVLWDMAGSPSSLNPCGTGTMTLTRIWTGEKK